MPLQLLLSPDAEIIKLLDKSLFNYINYSRPSAATSPK